MPLQHPQDTVHCIHDDIIHHSSQASGQLFAEHPDEEAERKKHPLAFKNPVSCKDAQVKLEYDAWDSILGDVGIGKKEASQENVVGEPVSMHTPSSGTVLQ